MSEPDLGESDEVAEGNEEAAEENEEVTEGKEEVADVIKETAEGNEEGSDKIESEAETETHVATESQTQIKTLAEEGDPEAKSNKSKVTILSVPILPPKDVVEAAREAFSSGRTRNYKFRKDQLKRLMKLYTENGDALIEAVNQDMKKPMFEAYASELNVLKNDLKNITSNFNSWAKPESTDENLLNIIQDQKIYKDPYGVVLIMTSWNYPIYLALRPLAAAMAAGNCVIVKPSEVMQASGELLAQLFSTYLDEQCYQIYLGGEREVTDLLKEKFDYIFYAGSTSAAKTVYEAAAQYLTPVTLELGGKSPVYIDESADIDIAAKRILWGKLVNGGQSYVAPEYVLCSKEVEQHFVEAATLTLVDFYGEETINSPDFCRIMSDKHLDRLSGLLKEGTVALGGGVNAQERFIEPTIITDVSENSPLMTEEIFGPILPIMNVDDVDQALDYINSKDKPLAAYIFSNNEKLTKKFLMNVKAGGITVNDTVCNSSPFSGVMKDGVGYGRFGFDTFVTKKGVLKRSMTPRVEQLYYTRYPPYNQTKLFVHRMMNTTFGLLSAGFCRYLMVFVFGMFFANMQIQFLDPLL